MTDVNGLAAVIDALGSVAPEVDVRVDDASLDADLFDEFGLDSMDALNLAAAIAERSGVEIPDRDAATLRTVRQLAAYVDRRYLNA
jgi:acyl carrier protein